MSGRVEGKVVIVTGGARGQGAAEAAALAAEGALVTATDVIEPEVQLAPGIEFLHHDVTSESDWADVVDGVIAAHRRVDGLVNNAGISWRARVGDVTRADWDRVLAVNVTGPLLGMQAVAPHMTEGGSIVNICSLAALSGHYTSAYTASKWALRGLSRVASLEFGPRQIRVNAVFPGHIDTPMVSTAPPSIVDLSVEEIPLARIGTPDDVAPLIVFLVSDDSKWISGAEIVVDGGQHAHGGMKRLSDGLRGLAGG